ncbi:MAG: hypothetical protein HGB03_02565 [Candidatus Yonathbacteria bacterium]|nr:hypothetical protein [Candidatus Yonathbacteria bacterium]NTW47476.1 hypothetical protein [Candidatus Yonathbacteria bacterium]
MKQFPPAYDVAIVYDGDCPDGFGGAWSAWKIFGDEATYIPGRYGEDKSKELAGKHVYFIDFCYEPRDVIVALRPHVQSITLIDHHKTRADMVDMPEIDDALIDMEQSGAVLAWKYFHEGQPIPQVLQHIQDFDLWRWQLSDTDEVVEMLSTYPFDFSLWDGIIASFETKGNEMEQYLAEGRAIVRKRDDSVARIVDDAEDVVFEGIPCLLANSRAHVSHVGAALAKKMPPIGIIWSRRDEQLICSLRSDGSVDVSELAKRYGGGGHKVAAAFRIHDPEFTKLAELFGKKER